MSTLSQLEQRIKEAKAMQDINDTPKERGARYGDFETHAQCAQDLKTVMQMFIPKGATAPPWDELPAMHREALDMFAHNIARILNGDPNYADNWHDIAGYARLVEERIGK